MLTESMPIPMTATIAETGTELKLTYSLIIGRYGGGEIPPYTAYGVEIRLCCEGKPEETARVEDITTYRARAEELLEKLRRNQVTPVTLRDVIQDSLGVCTG